MSSKDYFDEVAKDWDTMRTAFFSEKVREKAYELAEVEEGKTAADFGAGTGFVTEGLLERKVKVYAVDQSKEMLELLRNKLGDKGDLVCVQGDSGNVPIQDYEMDYVFANMFLHHVEEPLTAIREMYRILKKGGKLVITDLDEHKFEFLKTEQFDVWMGFDRQQISEWYKEAGFINVNVTCVGCNCCADSEQSEDKANVSIFAAIGEKN